MPRVFVKWGKERLEVEANADEPPLVLKSQLFALTGVAPDRQKLMLKGKTVADEIWSEGNRLTEGATLMMMGSSEAVPVAVAQGKFLEDMTAAQVAASNKALPVGLKNLGNTCYMNASIQCLRTIPELADVLKSYRGQLALDTVDFNSRGQSMTTVVRELFAQMNRARSQNSTEVMPIIMLQVLHTVAPQFSSRDDHGHLMQQDANEFWTELITLMKDQLKTGPNSTFVQQFMTGQFSVTLRNLEVEDEEPVHTTEDFVQLSCYLGQEVKYVQLGIKNKMTEEIVKHCTSLDRDANYQRTTLLSRLPAYLTVQLVRFFYKERDQVNAKILKDVKFPLALDLYEMCSPELKDKLRPMRDLFKDEEEREIDKARKIKAGEAVAETIEKIIPFSFEDDVGSNNSAFYQLQAVLTHKGRSSNSGHYVAWLRTEAGWAMCDDENVFPVDEESVLKLSGGGDWHCAYLLLYGPRILTQHLPIVKDDA